MTTSKRLASLLLLLAAAGALAPAQDDSSNAASQAAPSWKPIAVAGIEPAETLDERDRWMPTAIEETLAWRLRRAPGLTVIPTIRLHQSRLELAEKVDDPPAPWSRVVSLIGADYWLRGVCSGTPYKTVLDLELLGADQPDATPPATRIGPARLFDALDEATRWTLGQMNITRIDEKTQNLILAPPAKSPTALEYYAKALGAARANNLREAAYYASRSIESDPTYAPALMLMAKIELRSPGRLWRRAEIRLRQIQQIIADRRDPATEAECEIAQGLLLMMNRSLAPAKQRFDTALALARKTNDPYARLGAMNCLCDYWLNVPRQTEKSEDGAEQQSDQLNVRKAVEWELRVLELLRELDDFVARAPGSNKLAVMYETLNEPELALKAYLQTIEAAKAIDSKRTQAAAYLFLGQWYKRHERWPEALEAAQQCFMLVPDDAKPAIRISLGEILRGLKQPQKALDEYETAYQALADGDDMLSQFHCLQAVAELQMELGNPKAAIDKLTDALDYAQVLELDEEENIREQLAQWKTLTP